MTPSLVHPPSPLCRTFRNMCWQPIRTNTALVPDARATDSELSNHQIAEVLLSADDISSNTFLIAEKDAVTTRECSCTIFKMLARHIVNVCLETSFEVRAVASSRPPAATESGGGLAVTSLKQCL
ncbi:unnamed protein product [Leptosia nina]|uniref:Uncharacterized protein n=1 Tax=Leptosia nina TaxID=320188 RepID=A0AAV1JJS2_9NEOP